MAGREGRKDYMGAGEVARLLHLSDSRVRQLALAGELVEATRIGGRRLYRRADVERFKKTRAKERRGPSRAARKAT